MTQDESHGSLLGHIETYGTALGALVSGLSGHEFLAAGVGLFTQKAVRETINKFVYGVSEIPLEWLNTKKLDMKQKGELNREIRASHYKKAQDAVPELSTVEQRAFFSGIVKLEETQKKKEDIALRTLRILSEKQDESPEESYQAPNDDFMLYFENLVEKVSSEELRDLMARTLAGEIRKPGSISRASLRVIEVVEKQTIESLLFIKPYVMNHHWVDLQAFEDKEAVYKAVSDLSFLGLTTEIGLRQYGFNEQGFACLGYGAKAIIVKTDQTNKSFRPVTDGFNLTKIGCELIDLIPESDALDFDKVLENYRKNQFLSGVGSATFSKEKNAYYPD